MARVPEDLKLLVRAALETVARRSPRHSLQAVRLFQVPDSSYRLMGKRLASLIDNTRPEAEYTQDEQELLGRALVQLDRYAAGKTGPTPRGNEYRLMVYLNDAENAALEEYCDRNHVTKAAAVREALRLLGGQE